MPDTYLQTLPPRQTVTVKIDSLAHGPYGVGRDQRRVILVPLTAPGDEVEARIVSEKKNYATAELVHLLQPSPQRQRAPCPYFPRCGGCPWQHVSYPQQLRAKENIVLETLRRIGHFEDFPLLPIVSSPDEYHYRRRIRLQCRAGKELGFHSAFSHELIEVDACLIADAEFSRTLAAAREWTAVLRTALRNVEIVKADREGTAVLVGKAAAAWAGADEAACARFLARHGEICGLVIAGRGWRRAWGETTITFRPQDVLPLSAQADVFSQVNEAGSQQLVRALMDWGEFTKRDRILELYSGAGNFTLPMAQQAREVIAVEQNSQAVEDGKTNGRAHQLDNILWLSSNVGPAVVNLSRERERFTKIILNPPRTGAKGLEGGLASFAAEKIFYVSCNPATLARDLAGLRKQGYTLARVQPFDLFPHTFHVEAVAEMVR